MQPVTVIIPKRKLLGRQIPVPQQCPKCPTKCRSPLGLRLHLLWHAGTTKSRLKCSYCPERFATQLAKNTHFQQTHRDSNFAGEDCTICTANCRGTYKLRKYYMDHERHRKCAMCGDWLSDFNTLRRHMQNCGSPKEPAKHWNLVRQTSNMEDDLPKER